MATPLPDDEILWAVQIQFKNHHGRIETRHSQAVTKAEALAMLPMYSEASRGPAVIIEHPLAALMWREEHPDE